MNPCFTKTTAAPAPLPSRPAALEPCWLGSGGNRKTRVRPRGQVGLEVENFLRAGPGGLREMLFPENPLGLSADLHPLGRRRQPPLAVRKHQRVEHLRIIER